MAAFAGEIMKIRLIATDMDGTFLDDDKRIPEENWNALLECVEKGIEIVPATGRTIPGIPQEIKELPGVRYVIATNGALIADLKENRLISTCRLAPELAVSVLELARSSEDDIMYDAYVDGVGYTMPCFYDHAEKYVDLESVRTLIRKTRKVVPDNIAFIRERACGVDKINMFFQNTDARERMRRKLQEIRGILVTSSIPGNLEINAEGADKGSALLRLAEYLGISREETMAFGDGENDCTMIEMAGVGVAMSNGEEAVRAAADYVTDGNNDAGVAKAIRKLVLG